MARRQRPPKGDLGDKFRGAAAGSDRISSIRPSAVLPKPRARCYNEQVSNSRRAFIESSPLWGDAIDISVEAPDRNATRLAVAAAINSTGLWKASPYQVTRIYLTPVVRINSFDWAAREQAAGLLANAIASEVDDARTVRLLDWVFGPWLNSTAHRMHLSAESWNRFRTIELERMRTPALAPWLAGGRPVRDLGAFQAFHIALSPEERFAARLIAYWARWGAGIPANTGGWFAPAATSLAAAGWIEVAGSRLVAGPGLRHLAIGQGELLEA